MVISNYIEHVELCQHCKKRGCVLLLRDITHPLLAQVFEVSNLISLRRSFRLQRQNPMRQKDIFGFTIHIFDLEPTDFVRH